MYLMEEYGSSSTSAIANASPAFLRSCRAGSRFSFSTTSFILDNNRPSFANALFPGIAPKGRLGVAKRHANRQIFRFERQNPFLERLPLLLVPHLVVEPHRIHGESASFPQGSCR